MSWLTAAAIVLSLLPGVFSWISGIRLIQLRDDPALPERLHARSVQVGWFTAVAFVPVVMLPGSLVWKIPLVLLSLILGDFPVRRRVFEERWGLGRYLLFTGQIVAAVGAFWLILLFSPGLVAGAGTSRWVVASLLAIMLLLWSVFYTTVFVWVMRGRPFSPPPLFDRITRQTKIRTPLLVSFKDPGGRFINAFAFPSLRRPIVAFTSTLLEMLTVEEQAAVYAHEVAHVEGSTRASLWRAEFRDVLLIATGTFGAAALPSLFRPPILWFSMILLWAGYRRAKSRAGEERADLRAVTLSGDSESVVRALVKMTTYTRVPRRWDVDLEREATHPSLARRIQAIRRLAGQTEAPMVAAAFPLTLPGQFVIFAPDRITRLEGVAPGTSIDPEVLRTHASRAEEIHYAELIELRVKAAIWSAPRIVLTRRTGRVRILPIRLADVPRIQAVLDRVDLHLAPVPAPLRFELLLVRALAVGFLFLVARSPILSIGIVASVGLAGSFPVPVSFAILAAASVAEALAVLIGNRHLVFRELATGLALIILAIVAIWERRRLLRKAVYRNRLVTVVLPLALGSVGLVAAWVGTYVDEIAGRGWVRLDRALAIDPEAWIAPVALAGGLLSIRNGWAKAAGALLLCSAIVLVALRTGVINLHGLFPE